MNATLGVVFTSLLAGTTLILSIIILVQARRYGIELFPAIGDEDSQGMVVALQSDHAVPLERQVETESVATRSGISDEAPEPEYLPPSRQTKYVSLFFEKMENAYTDFPTYVGMPTVPQRIMEVAISDNVNGVDEVPGITIKYGERANQTQWITVSPKYSLIAGNWIVANQSSRKNLVLDEMHSLYLLGFTFGSTRGGTRGHSTEQRPA